MGLAASAAFQSVLDLFLHRGKATVKSINQGHLWRKWMSLAAVGPCFHNQQATNWCLSVHEEEK